MSQKHSFQLHGSNLKATDFDQFLFAVYNVPFFGVRSTERDISSMKPIILKCLRIGLRIFKVTWDDKWPSDTEFASDVIRADIISFVIN
jgi:hypothetical protein